MLILKSFVFNAFAENTYIAWCDDTKEGAVIDPGCYHPDEENELVEYIEKNKLKIKYLINTHCHIDHVLGNGFILKTYSPVYMIPEKDLILLENFERQCEAVHYEVERPPLTDLFITEETNIALGKITPKFLFTPGHTAGEYCIYFNSEKKCITGDVLFQQSIGRTDLWGGDYETLINSIGSKLMTLEDDVIIYPGHGSKSTIGEERNFNPYLSGINKI